MKSTPLIYMTGDWHPKAVHICRMIHLEAGPRHTHGGRNTVRHFPKASHLARYLVFTSLSPLLFRSDPFSRFAPF